MLVDKFTEFRSLINEGIKLGVTRTCKAQRPVNIIIGRFQPITSGHLKVVNEMYTINGNPTLFVAVRPEKVNPKREFFDRIVINDMIHSIMKNDTTVKGIVNVKSANIIEIFNECRFRGYEPVLIGCGTDRIQSYQRQVNDYSKFLFTDDLTTHEISRSSDDVSATKVRQMIIDGDEASFSQYTHPTTIAYFDILKNQLTDK